MKPSPPAWNGYSRQMTEEWVQEREALNLLRQIEGYMRVVPMPFRDIVRADGAWNQDAFMTDALHAGDLFKWYKVNEALKEILNIKRVVHDVHNRDESKRWER